MTTFYAHGKLLLTAEYFVLDGAVALALPTKFGQSLTVEKSPETFGIWQSFDADGSLWFETQLDDEGYKVLKTNDLAVAEQLVKILKVARSLKKDGGIYQAFSVKTELTFPRSWGLGTSSTLIFNLAALFQIDPFELLEKTFGGSGYDIACAGASQAILFDRKNDKPNWHLVDFKPPFSENLYFVYLGKKQNSREGIQRYKSKKGTPQYSALLTSEISNLTTDFLKCTRISDFEKLIIEHENLVASVIELPRAKALFFNDFWGEIKSLGAWGGDFVMATSERSEAETVEYFSKKGFGTVVKYADMVL